jgi:hypothetical protein
MMHEVMQELKSATAPNRRRAKVVRTLSEKTAHWEELAKETAELTAVPPALLLPPEEIPSPPLPPLSRHKTTSPRIQWSESARIACHASTPTLRRICSPGGSMETFVKWNQQTVGGSVSDPSQSYVDDAVKKRANEQCMPLLLRNQIERQGLRMGRRTGDRRNARVQTLELAGKFESVYAETRNAMEGRLCFDPPSRSNSVTEAEVAKALKQLGK